MIHPASSSSVANSTTRVGNLLGRSARADRGTLLGALEQLCRLEHQHVEIHEIPRREELLVLLEEPQVIVIQRVAAEPVCRESVERGAMPPPRPFDATQHVALIVLVSD